MCADVHRVIFLGHLKTICSVDSESDVFHFGQPLLPLSCVRVSGIVVEKTEDSVLLDDGTGVMPVIPDETCAAVYVPSVGDQVEYIGKIHRKEGNAFVSAYGISHKTNAMFEALRCLETVHLYKSIYFPGIFATSSPSSRSKQSEMEMESSPSRTSNDGFAFSQCSQDVVSLSALSSEVESFVQQHTQGVSIADLTAQFPQHSQIEIKDSLGQLLLNGHVYENNKMYHAL
eukprot:m.69947 g.69947  ORF g.69947 m.69947 type:complete len:230 (+) comp20031_c0_seq5:162-851(+)